MESVYAALILHKAKKKINEANIEKVLTAAGVDVDANQLKTLVAGLEGKDIDQLIASAAATPVASTVAVEKEAVKKESNKSSKKSEKKEEKKEEPTGIGALFG